MAQQAESVTIPKRIPLVLQPENRGEGTDKDSKIINAYVEKGVDGTYAVFKRPGTLQTGATITGAGLGVYNWLGDIYAIWGATIYKNGVAIGGGAPNGALNTAAGVYRWSSCLGATPALQFGNGAASYNYDGTTPITLIAGVNFSGTIVKGWAYLDGTTYVMNTLAEIKGCAVLNSPTDWTDALNTLTAQIEPDNGVALAKQLVYVIAFKQWTTEVFYDQTNPTASPLGPVQGAKVNYGCANQDSIQDIDGVLFWLATNRSAAPQIGMLDNLKFTPVSTKPIERILGNSDLTSVLSFGIKYEGHRFYGLTLKNNNITLVYDPVENLWAQWTDSAGNYFPISSTTYSSTLGILLQHESNGKLYTMDASYLDDDAAIITVDLYTPNFDGGTTRGKNCKQMHFVGDKTAGSVIMVRVNDNDYDPTRWSNFRSVYMSQTTPMLSDCGTFKRRAWHLRHQSKTAMRLFAVEPQIDICTL